jgi:hypothetical protein
MTEEFGPLNEKLITLAGQAYPKFGNVIIMAGGAGSGKGFVKNRLIGAEGFTFDVDLLKTIAARTPAIAKKVKEELGIDMAELSANLKNPENVQKLHEIIGEYLGLDDKKMKTLYQSIISAAPDRKPNLIFDVTLRDFRKLETITRQVKALGYGNDKIHIIWVVNDIEIAKAQNAKRSRTVPVEILINTHRGVSSTMNDIFQMGEQIKKYMDGDIVIAFNKVGVDSSLEKSDKGGSYVKDANYFYIKRSGKGMIPFDEIDADIKRKIAAYVPKGVVWESAEVEDDVLDEGYFKMHPDDTYSYTVWKKDLHTGKLSHKEHLDNSGELQDWMDKVLGKHATILVKQDQSGKEITYTDNGTKFVPIDKKK